MTRRPDHPDELLLDSLQGELDADAQAALEARLAVEPELAAERDALARLLAFEREVFEPAAQTASAEADAGRMAAWVRSTVQADETAETRVRFAPAKQRSWARILAWSVGLHVVLLGVLAFVSGGDDAGRTNGLEARIVLDAEDEGLDFGDIVDYRGAALAMQWERAVTSGAIDDMADKFVLEEQETDDLADSLAGLEDDQPAAWHGLSHPVGVVVSMTRRKRPELRRRRLDLLGFNAQGTLKAVDKGLGFLARLQAADGSYRREGAATASIRETSVVLLAFLGNGHTSRGRKDRDGVVRKGVDWLRGQLFEKEARKGRSLLKAGLGADTDLGPATVALCEDYMLSYGELPPQAAARRANEIAALAAASREQVMAAAGEDRTWRVWALDAASRAGIVTSSSMDDRVFRSWVQTAAATSLEPGGTASSMAALSAGTALLFAERGAAKPRFLDWSKANATSLVGRLTKIGRAKTGDAVSETAMILLALQVAYRTY